MKLIELLASKPVQKIILIISVICFLICLLILAQASTPKMFFHCGILAIINIFNITSSINNLKGKHNE